MRQEGERSAAPDRSRSVHRALAPIVLALVPMLVLGACGSDSESSSSTTSVAESIPPQSGGSLVVGVFDDPEGFNPAANRISDSALSAFKALYDPIAVIDDQGQAVPYLVESIEPNEDFTEWTITMRDGIQFHNGDALTPEVMATHLKTMQLATLTSFAFKSISAVGVVDESASTRFEDGELTEEEYDVMRRQVVVLMNRSWSTFPVFLATYQAGFVAHPDFVAGEIDEPIGTGPFVLDEFVPDDHVTFVRNPDYWREGLPYLDEVEFRPLPDPTSRAQALQAGDIDMMISDSPEQVAELSEQGVPDGQQLVEDPSQDDEQLILLNTQSGPTAESDVRRALQLATDASLLNEALYRRSFELATMPFSSDSFWHSEPDWPAPDPEAATELVDAWEAENGPLSITLDVYNNPDDINLGQAIQMQWDAVGIETNVEARDDSGMITAITLGDYEAVLNQALSGEDPDIFYPFLDPENIGAPGELSLNFTRYSSAVTEDVLLAGRTSGDADERKQDYDRLWEDLAENAPYLFLWHTRQLLVANGNVQGLGDFATPDDTPAPAMLSGSIYVTEIWLS